MPRHNNENMKGETISSVAVNINDGMKVIVYLDKPMISRIMEQIKENHGMLNHTTAMAIAANVAKSVAQLDWENWQELRSTPHKSSNPEDDVEEDDDPRTVFMGYGDGDE